MLRLVRQGQNHEANAFESVDCRLNVQVIQQMIEDGVVVLSAMHIPANTLPFFQLGWCVVLGTRGIRF